MPPHDDDTPIVPIDAVQPDEHPMTLLRRSIETMDEKNVDAHKKMFEYIDEQTKQISDHESRIAVAEKSIDNTDENVKELQETSKEKSKETRGLFYVLGGGIVLFIFQRGWDYFTGKAPS